MPAVYRPVLGEEWTESALILLPSCPSTISLLGSGKTEENKENDLQPPVPQSYAATVARQSTVPSTSTMPGEPRGCPSLGQRSEKAPGGKWQSPKLPRVRCSKTPRDCRALWSSPSPSPGVAQAFSALLAGPLVQRCSQTGPWPSRNHIRALELVRQQPASCQTGFQELEPWLWKSDLTGFFCVKFTTDCPEPVTLHRNRASTELLLCSVKVCIQMGVPFWNWGLHLGWEEANCCHRS